MLNTFCNWWNTEANERSKRIEELNESLNKIIKSIETLTIIAYDPNLEVRKYKNPKTGEIITREYTLSKINEAKSLLKNIELELAYLTKHITSPQDKKLN